MQSENVDCTQKASADTYGFNARFNKAQSRIIPTLVWLALLGWEARVTVLVRQRSGFAFSSVDLHAAVQIFFVFAIFLIIVSNSRLSPLISEARRTSIIMLFVYYIMGILSALWSPMPAFTFYRAFEFVTLLMGVLFALSYCSDFYAAERKMLFISTIVLIFCLLMKLKLSGIAYSLEHWHATTYTTSGAMIFCYCAGEYFFSEKSRKKMLRRYGIFALALVLLGTSSGSFISAIAGLLLILFFYRNAGLWGLGILLFAVVILIGVDWTPVKNFIFYGKSERAITTLHGRVYMWDSFMGMIAQKPFFGNGFGVFMRSPEVATSGHPHNSIFSVLLGTGILGAIPVIVFFFRLLREFLKTTSHRLPGAIGCSAAISTGLINSLTSPFVLDKWDESTLVFACLIALFILFVVKRRISER
jgi:O-antigen ligase